METVCPVCSMEYQLDENLVGRTVECECGVEFIAKPTSASEENSLGTPPVFECFDQPRHNSYPLSGDNDQEQSSIENFQLETLSYAETAEFDRNCEEPSDDVPYATTLTGMKTVKAPYSGTLSGMKTVSCEGIQVTALVDNFRIKEKLGAGGYGVVYRATDEETGHDVAVKLLPHSVSGNPDLLEDIRDNFDLVAALEHPGIVRLLDFHHVTDVDQEARLNLGLMRGSCFVVMEHVSGVTLDRWQRGFEKRRVPFGDAVKICRKVAAVLDHAHSKKIIHRDIKPANIIITGDDVKVLDFGIAAQIRTSLTKVTVKRGQGAGTPTHMAPEQWEGKRQGPATDQYALATMFYELISGEVPFESALSIGTDAMARCVIGSEPDKPYELNSEQWKALIIGLSKKQSDRYRSCTTLIDAIETPIEFNNKPNSRFEPVYSCPSNDPHTFSHDKVSVPVEGKKQERIISNIDLRQKKESGQFARAISEVESYLASVRAVSSNCKSKYIERIETYHLCDKIDSTLKELDTLLLDTDQVAMIELLCSDADKLQKQISLTPDGAAGWVIPKLNMELIYVEKGQFKMGSNNLFAGDEKPSHSVTIRRHYWIGKYPVMQSEYNRANRTDCRFDGERNPVENITWFEAVKYCDWLTEQERNAGRMPEGYVYRLPSEAEWEFAARGGSKSRNYKYAGSNSLDSVGWFVSNSASHTYPVGRKAPNELGLYDMSGNVAEWCHDWYGKYTDYSEKDPIGAGCGKGRVIRGGGIFRKAQLNSNTYRAFLHPEAAATSVGFRICLAPHLGERQDVWLIEY